MLAVSVSVGDHGRRMCSVCDLHGMCRVQRLSPVTSNTRYVDFAPGRRQFFFVR